MILCDFFVQGDPVAQPRLRPRMSRAGRLGVHMPPTAQAWRQRVLLAAREAWSRGPLEGPLDVDLRFFLRRPKSHYTARGALRESAPAYPTGKPDRDNLEKSTLDALNGALWVDDAQIVEGSVSKEYVCHINDEPGAMVTVKDMR